MKDGPVLILLVEDEEAHVELVRHVFEAQGGRFRLVVAHTLAEARSCLASASPDLILSDLSLPDGRGVDLLPAGKKGPSIPLVVMTGHGDEEIAVEAMRAGALDYVVKSAETFADMPRVAERALRQWGQVVERRRAEEKLRENLNLLHAVIEGSDDLIFCKDLEGRHLLVNSATARFLGRSVEESVGKTTAELFPPEVARSLEEADRQVMESGEPLTFEEHLPHAEGERVYLTRKSPYYDPDGQVAGVLGIGRDISGRVRIEEALRASEAQYRELVEEIDEVIYAVDEEGVLTYVSPAVESLLGIPPAEAIGRHFGEFIHPEDLPRLQESFESLLGGQTTTDEYRLVTRSGQIRWVHASNRPQVVAGRVSGVHGVVMDVSERVRAEEAMIQASRLEATATLAGGIAHRVNNLMVGVLGYGELLRADFAADTDALDMLNRICGAAQQASDLATQMLAFARRGTPHPEALDLNQVIEDVLYSQKRALRPEIRLQLDLEPDLWAVRGDATQMGQVLLNLFTNAAEAIEGSGRIALSTGNVEIGPEGGELDPGRYVCLSMRDTGRGMSAKVQARAFEPFFSTKFQGRGLGLAAAYGIVKHHGGLISVQSEEGRGSTFEVYLPALP